MNTLQDFESLGRKQLAVLEGIAMLERIQHELLTDASAARGWGNLAILANMAIVPLNVIINAFDLKPADTAYRLLVRELYGAFGRSGTRVEGPAKTALSSVKQAIVSELKRKALAEFIPGVNIVVGLAEDSYAAFQVAERVMAGNIEIAACSASLNLKIAAANRQLRQLGTRRADVLAKLETYARTS